MKKEFKGFAMRVDYVKGEDIVRTSVFTSGGFTNGEEDNLSPNFDGGGKIDTPFDAN